MMMMMMIMMMMMMMTVVSAMMRVGLCCDPLQDNTQVFSDQIVVAKFVPSLLDVVFCFRSIFFSFYKQIEQQTAPFPFPPFSNQENSQWTVQILSLSALSHPMLSNSGRPWSGQAVVRGDFVGD